MLNTGKFIYAWCLQYIKYWMLGYYNNKSNKTTAADMTDTYKSLLIL